MQQYISAFLERSGKQMSRQMAQWDVTAEELTAEVTRRSEGNFMYLVHVLPDLASDVSGSGRAEAAQDAAVLPQGLRGYDGSTGAR